MSKNDIFEGYSEQYCIKCTLGSGIVITYTGSVRQKNHCSLLIKAKNNWHLFQPPIQNTRSPQKVLVESDAANFFFDISKTFKTASTGMTW